MIALSPLDCVTIVGIGVGLLLCAISAHILIRVNRVSHQLHRLGNIPQPRQRTHDAKRMATGASIAQVVHTSLRGFGPRLEKQGVDVVVNLPPTLPPVRGDTQRLTLVFDQLIANALAAMPDGGQLYVKGGRVGNEVRLKLLATGKGPPTEQQHDSSNRHCRGDGRMDIIRLRQILGRCDAAVELCARQGVGATAVVHFPVAASTCHSRAN